MPIATEAAFVLAFNPVRPRAPATFLRARCSLRLAVVALGNPGEHLSLRVHHPQNDLARDHENDNEQDQTVGSSSYRIVLFPF
jgi:hypothetical protein